MLGFIAPWIAGEPRPQEDEIQDVRWFSRDEVAAAAARGRRRLGRRPRSRGPGRDRAPAAAAPRHRAAPDRALARRGLAQATAAAAQSAAAAATWRSSVPQQPPITVTDGSSGRSAAPSAPSPAGSPSSRSVASSSSAWLARRGVRPQPRDPLAPAPARRQRGGEVRRVRAVDHVVGDRPERLGVDLLDRVAERLAVRQPPVGLDGERDDRGEPGRVGGAGDAGRLARHGSW